MGTDQFSLEINVACIILREKRSQRPVIIENNYSGEYITFECSTGEYIVEIQKMILCIQANYLYLNI